MFYYYNFVFGWIHTHTHTHVNLRSAVSLRLSRRILRVPVVVSTVGHVSVLLPNSPISCSLSSQPAFLSASASANPSCAELLPAGSERSPAGTLLSHPPAGTRLHFQPSTACFGFIMCVCAAAPPAEASRGGGRLVARVRTKKKQGDRG